MLKKDTAQRVLDHFKVGSLKRFEYWVFYYEVETNQGTFFIIEIEDNPLKADANEKEKSDKLKEEVPNIERLLTKGDQTKNSSFVHQNNRYYSVYKLIN